MYRLWMFVDPPSASLTASHDDGQHLTGVDGIHPSGRAGKYFDFIANTPDQWGCRMQASAPGYTPTNLKGILFLDGTEAFWNVDDITLQPAPVAPEPEPEPEPGVVPGCHGNKLTDPEAYFFSVIKRKKGDKADDFANVLRNTFPAGPGPNEHSDPHVHYGITQQIGAAGRIAGRLFLPAVEPDGLNYYTIQVDILADANGTDPSGGLLWTFVIKWDSRNYAAAPCW